MPKKKLYSVGSKKGVRGVVAAHKRPRRRKQDAKFEHGTFYACVFFPKIEGIGPAMLFKHSFAATLSASPKAAVAKFMDGKPKKDTWEQYRHAGWKVRKVRVSDMGPGR